MKRFRLVPAFALLLCACTAGGGVPPGQAGLEGRWGGVHAGLTITASGGTIEYDCAHGTLDTPVRPDSAGRFDVGGSHVRGHGGPARAGETPVAEPARYRGEVAGDRMTLTVVVGTDTLGPFALRRGAEPELFRCL